MRFWLITSAALLIATCNGCVLRKYKHGYVCVMNATHCEEFPKVLPQNRDEFVVVSSTFGGLRFRNQKGSFSSGELFQIPYTPFHDEIADDSLNIQEKIANIRIDETRKFQTWQGFGGSYTGSVAHNLNLVDERLRKCIYKLYFSEEAGLGYSFLKWPIGASDFDPELWMYNETPVDDLELSNFTELHNLDALRIQQIYEMMAYLNVSQPKVYAVAWAPPPWMKTNNDWSGVSLLKFEYYQTWADYHVKFIKLMKESGLTVWGIGIANEATTSPGVSFNTVLWPPSLQAKWVAENLGPTMRNSKFGRDAKIFFGEDQRTSMFPLWFSWMNASHPKSMDFMDGIGIHWYSDGVIPPRQLDEVHQMFPAKDLFITESALFFIDNRFIQIGPRYGFWHRSTKYLDRLFENVKHWVNGWIDWNLVVNQIGGPNIFVNYLDAPIIINTLNGEAYIEPSYFFIGHFAKYIPKDSVRIEATVTESSSIDAIAFLRPDNIVVVMLHNPYFVEMSQSVVIHTRQGRNKIHLKVPSYSVHTVLYNI